MSLKMNMLVFHVLLAAGWIVATHGFHQALAMDTDTMAYNTLFGRSCGSLATCNCHVDASLGSNAYDCTVVGMSVPRPIDLNKLPSSVRKLSLVNFSSTEATDSFVVMLSSGVWPALLIELNITSGLPNKLLLPTYVVNAFLAAASTGSVLNTCGARSYATTPQMIQVSFGAGKVIGNFFKGGVKVFSLDSSDSPSTFVDCNGTTISLLGCGVYNTQTLPTPSECTSLDGGSFAAILLQDTNAVHTSTTTSQLVSVEFTTASSGFLPLFALPSRLSGFSSYGFSFSNIPPGIHVLVGAFVPIPTGGVALRYAPSSSTALSPYSFLPNANGAILFGSPFGEGQSGGQGEGQGGGKPLVGDIAQVTIDAPPRLIRYPVSLSNNINFTLKNPNNYSIQFTVGAGSTVSVQRALDVVGFIGKCDPSSGVALFVADEGGSIAKVAGASVSSAAFIPNLSSGKDISTCDFLARSCVSNCKDGATPKVSASLVSRLVATPLTADITATSTSRRFAPEAAEAANINGVSNPVQFSSDLRHRTFVFMDGTNPTWAVLYPNRTLGVTYLNTGITSHFAPGAVANELTYLLPNSSASPLRSNCLLGFPAVPGSLFRAAFGNVYEFALTLSGGVYSVSLKSSRTFGGSIQALDAALVGGRSFLVVATGTSLFINGSYTHAYNCSNTSVALCNVTSVAIALGGSGAYAVDSNRVWLVSSELTATAMNFTMRSSSAAVVRPSADPLSSTFALVYPSDDGRLWLRVYKSPGTAWTEYANISVPFAPDAAGGQLMATAMPFPDSVVFLPSALLQNKIVFVASSPGTRNLSSPYLVQTVRPAQVTPSRRHAVFAAEVACASAGYTNNTAMQIHSIDGFFQSGSPSTADVLVDLADPTVSAFYSPYGWLLSDGGTFSLSMSTSEYIMSGSTLFTLSAWGLGTASVSPSLIYPLDNESLSIAVYPAMWAATELFQVAIVSNNVTLTTLRIDVPGQTAPTYIAVANDGALGTPLVTFHHLSSNVVVLILDVSGRSAALRVVDGDSKSVIASATISLQTEGVNDTFADCTVAPSERWSNPMKEDYVIRCPDGSLSVLSAQRLLLTPLVTSGPPPTLPYSEWPLAVTRGAPVPHQFASLHSMSVPIFQALDGSNALLVRQSEVTYQVTCPFTPLYDLTSSTASTTTVVAASASTSTSAAQYPFPSQSWCPTSAAGMMTAKSPTLLTFLLPISCATTALIQPYAAPRFDVLGSKRFFLGCLGSLSLLEVDGRNSVSLIAIVALAVPADTILQYRTDFGVRLVLLLSAQEGVASSVQFADFFEGNATLSAPYTPPDLDSGTFLHIAYSTDPAAFIVNNADICSIGSGTLSTGVSNIFDELYGPVLSLGMIGSSLANNKQISFISASSSTQLVSNLAACSPCGAPQIVIPASGVPADSPVNGSVDAYLICKCPGGVSVYHLSIVPEGGMLFAKEIAAPSIWKATGAVSMAWDGPTGAAYVVNGSSGEIVSYPCGGVPHLTSSPIVPYSAATFSCPCIANASSKDRSQQQCGGKPGYPASLAAPDAPVSEVRTTESELVAFTAQEAPSCVVRLDYASNTLVATRYDGTSFEGPSPTLLSLSSLTSNATHAAFFAQSENETYLVTLTCSGSAVNVSSVSSQIMAGSMYAYDVDPLRGIIWSLPGCGSKSEDVTVYRSQVSSSGSIVTTAHVVALFDACPNGKYYTPFVAAEDSLSGVVSLIMVSANNINNGSTRTSGVDPLLGPLENYWLTEGVPKWMARYASRQANAASVMSFVVSEEIDSKYMTLRLHQVGSGGAAIAQSIPALFQMGFLAIWSFVDVGLTAVPTMVVSTSPTGGTPSIVPLCAQCHLFSDISPFPGDVRRFLLFASSKQRLWLYRYEAAYSYAIELLADDAIPGYPVGVYESDLAGSIVQVDAVQPLAKQGAVASAFLVTASERIFRVAVQGTLQPLSTKSLGALPFSRSSERVRHITVHSNSTSFEWSLVFWSTGGSAYIYRHTGFRWTPWLMDGVLGGFDIMPVGDAASLLALPYVSVTGAITTSGGQVLYDPPAGVTMESLLTLSNDEYIFLLSSGEIMHVSANSGDLSPKLLGGYLRSNNIWKGGRLVWVDSSLPFVVSLPTNTSSSITDPNAFVHCLGLTYLNLLETSQEMDLEDGSKFYQVVCEGANLSSVANLTSVSYGSHRNTTEPTDRVIGLDFSGKQPVILTVEGALMFGTSVLHDLQSEIGGMESLRVGYPVVMSGGAVFFLEEVVAANAVHLRVVILPRPELGEGARSLGGPIIFLRRSGPSFATDYTLSVIRSKVASSSGSFPFHVIVGDKQGQAGVQLFSVDIFNGTSQRPLASEYLVIGSSPVSSQVVTAGTDALASASLQMTHPGNLTFPSTTFGRIHSTTFVMQLKNVNSSIANADDSMYAVICDRVGGTFRISQVYLTGPMDVRPVAFFNELPGFFSVLNMYFTPRRSPPASSVDINEIALVSMLKESSAQAYYLAAAPGSGLQGSPMSFDGSQQIAGSADGAIYTIPDSNPLEEGGELAPATRQTCFPPNPMLPFFANATLLQPCRYPKYAPLSEWLGCSFKVARNETYACDFRRVVGGSVNLSAIPPSLRFSLLQLGTISASEGVAVPSLAPGTATTFAQIDVINVYTTTFLSGTVLFDQAAGSLVPTDTMLFLCPFQGTAGVRVGAYNDADSSSRNVSLTVVVSLPINCPTLYGVINASNKYVTATRRFNVACAKAQFQVVCPSNGTSAESFPNIHFYSQVVQGPATIGVGSGRYPCQCPAGTIINLTEAKLCGGPQPSTKSNSLAPTISRVPRTKTHEVPTTTTAPTTVTTTSTTRVPTDAPPLTCDLTSLQYRFVGSTAGSVDNVTDDVTGSSTYSKRTVADLAKGDVTIEIFASVESTLQALVATNHTSREAPKRNHIGAGDELLVEGVFALREVPPGAVNSMVAITGPGTSIARIAEGIVPIPIVNAQTMLGIAPAATTTPASTSTTSNATTPNSTFTTTAPTATHAAGNSSQGAPSNTDSGAPTAWARSLRVTLRGAGTSSISEDLTITVTIARSLFTCPYRNDTSSASNGTLRRFAAAADEQGDLTVSITFSKYVSALPAAVRETVQVTSVITRSAAGMTAAPTVAGMTARSTILVQLSTCEFSDYAPLDLTQSLTGLGFGDAKGYYFRGGVIGNVALLLGCAALMFLIALALALFSKRLRALGPKEAYLGALLRLHFPAFMVVPYLTIMPGLAMCAVATLWHGNGDGTDIGIGIFGILVSLALPSAIIAPVYFSLPCEYVEISYFDQEDAFLSFFTGTWHWETVEDDNGEPVDGTFKTKFGIVFKDYARRAWWFLTVEVGLTYIAAILDGVRPSTEYGCIIVAWAFLVVNVLMLLFIIGARPYIAIFENLFALSSNAIVAVGCAFLVVSMHISDEEDSAGVGAVAETLGLVATFMALGKIGTDILINGYIIFRDTVRRNTSIDAAKYVDVTDSRQAQTLSKKEVVNLASTTTSLQMDIGSNPTFGDTTRPLLLDVSGASFDDDEFDEEELLGREASDSPNSQRQRRSTSRSASLSSVSLGSEPTASLSNEESYPPLLKQSSEQGLVDDDDALL